MAYKKKRAFKKRTFKRRSFAPKKKAIKRIVKQVISRQEETKSKQQYVSGYNLYPTNAANFVDNVVPLGPNSTNLPVTQGVGAGERIGNKIRTKRLVFRGTLVPLPYNVTWNPLPRPVQVKLMILYDRNDETSVPVPGSGFFQDGSSSAGFSNALMDMMRPINNDRYRLLAQRTFKLGFASYAGTGVTAGSQAFVNNDFKLNQSFSMDVTKLYPKTVKFNDNLGDPTTRGIYAFWYYVAADGTALPATNISCQINFMQDFRYSDA